jgi:hypothetical protein
LEFLIAEIIDAFLIEFARLAKLVNATMTDAEVSLRVFK